MAAPPKLRYSHVFRRALALAAALFLISAPAAWAQLPGDSGGGTGGVGDAVGDVGNDAGDAVGDVGSGVGDAVGDVTDGTDDSGGNEGDGGIDDVVEDVGNGAGDVVGDIGGGVGDAIDETAGNAGTKIDETTGTVGGQVGGTVGGISIPGGELILGGKGKKDQEPAVTVPFQGSISAADGVLGIPLHNAAGAVSEIKDPLPKEPPYSTTTVPAGDDQSVIEKLAQAAAEAAKRFAFPLALSLVVGGFLMLQNRLDNRDRKLALAPVDAEQDLLSFK